MSSKSNSYYMTAFKMHGYSLQSKASMFLNQTLGSVNEVEREDLIDRLLETIQKQNLSSNIISQNNLEEALKQCERTNEDSNLILTIINAFDVPKYVYNIERKKFLKDTETGRLPPSLLSTADDKASLFCDRYQMLYQRTSRHKLFTPPILGVHETNARKFQLKNVEYLHGCSAKLKDIIVLGMLTQLKESKYYLEDPTGAVALDLSEAKFHTGLFTENSFVLAEGWYEDEIFHVTAFGFPPAETSKTTRAYYGNINFFGGPSNQCAKASAKLLEKEQENEDAMFLFLLDVWLDQESVLKKLETLFLGFSECPPMCVVMAGPFCSAHRRNSHQDVTKEGLANLAKLILRFDLIHKETRFVFVPAHDDPGMGQILPRPPFPSVITEDFIKKIPNSTFASNPCRIQYYSQEIVIFREDIIKKMCRNSIKCPTTDIPEQFVKSILSQGHLCPLPLHVSPVYWMFDHTLHVYPIPDVIVFCDRTTKPFEISQLDCTCISPGSFAGGDFNFKAYYPSSKTVEDCKVET